MVNRKTNLLQQQQKSSKICTID